MTTERIVRASTLTEQVYRVIKQRITSGAYEGGYHLVERQLADEFGVSKTPVREALARLEREGLVVFDPGRGMRVRSLSLKEIDDILELREVIEGFIGEKAAILATEEQIARLERILTEAEDLPLTEIERYKELDGAFHELMREMAGNSVVNYAIGLLQAQISLVMSTTIALPGRRAASVREHRDIFDAIRARDPRSAGEYARIHLRNARKALTRYYGYDPAYTGGDGPGRDGAKPK